MKEGRNIGSNKARGATQRRGDCKFHFVEGEIVVDVSVTDPLQMANLAVQCRFIAGSTHLREVVKIS